MSDKRTQKQINEEIKAIEAQISDIRDVRKHHPELVELEKKVYEIKQKHYEESQSLINCWDSDIDALKKELKRKKEDNDIQLSERVEKWLRKYLSGVNFGYKEPRIVWISEDERYVIITSPGGTAGTGTVMGTGGYYYAASTHWLTETIEGVEFMGNRAERAPEWLEHEGRLTKEVKQNMIDYTKELRNTKNNEQ
jgi:hypothetical protein